MKSVLLSVHPKWCELIASGKKTVEVRKTRPKIDTPFNCYIYATKPKIRSHPARIYNSYIMPESGECGSGKVIGEFVCHNISEFESELWDDETYERITRVVHTEDWEGYPETESYYVAEDGEDNYLCRQSCLTWEDLRGYVGQDINTFFGWHISDLKIYERPKELSEFWTIKCTNKKGSCAECAIKPKCINHLNRPPQSWCYVEYEK